VINPLRRRNRGLTPEQSEEVQKLVFELVRERLAAAFGREGMWSVTMKDRNAVDGIFSATVAETLAWDVAAKLAQPKKSRHQAAAETKPSRAPQPILPAPILAPSPAADIEPRQEESTRERLVA
jgi:hypothetical protein